MCLAFFLLIPINLVLSVLGNIVSRRNEFEADQFAFETTGSTGPSINALKKLYAHSFTHLTPHPLEVFLYHSHPPVMQRIAALRRLAAEKAMASSA